MCSKLGLLGYGQIAQICKNEEMFVHVIHADKFRVYVGFIDCKKRRPINAEISDVYGS